MTKFEGVLTRREAIGAAGVVGAGIAGLGLADAFAPGLTGGGTATAAETASAASTCSTLTPEKEPGPYFVDARVNRSDIRTDASTGVAQAGIPLTLTLYVYAADDNCTPYAGAVVDIWNANASGVYSDEASESTTGTTYLRGYQVTDSNGMVKFTTNMPGWYQGRSMHVHLEIRTFSGSTVSYEWQTQLFFGETIDSAVASSAPYVTSDKNSPRVVDTADRVWQEDWTGTADTAAVNDGAEVTPALTGNTTDGYTGTFAIVLDGLPTTNADGFGTSTATTTSTTGTTGTTTSPTTGTTTTGTTPTTTTNTQTADAALSSFHFTHNTSGKRFLVLGLTNGEAVQVAAELVRGSKKTVLAKKGPVSLGKGAKTLKLPIPNSVAAGASTLYLAFKDSSGNSKAVTRTVKIPKRQT